MRTLKFIVDKQIIKPDSNCDFSGLIPGTEGYLRVEFLFSPEWKNCRKVAEFWRWGKECPPQILEDGKSCVVPAEALVGKTFKMRVLGQSNEMKLTTNKVTVCQNGGKK